MLFNEITIGFLSAKLGIAARIAIRISPDKLDKGKVAAKLNVWAEQVTRNVMRLLLNRKKAGGEEHNRIEVWFRGKFCYIDAYTDPFVPPEYDPELYGGKSREERIGE